MPEISACNTRKGIARNVFYVGHAMPIARQWVAKHIPAIMNTSTAMQQHGKQRGKHAFTTTEEVVSCMGLSQDYISLVINQKSVIVRRMKIQGVHRIATVLACKKT
jgi:hypothetical protein